MAAQKARVSEGIDRGDLGVFIGYFLGKRAMKSDDFGEIRSGQYTYWERSLWLELGDALACGSRPLGKGKKTREKK
jgi:hypothetical protein